MPELHNDPHPEGTVVQVRRLCAGRYEVSTVSGRLYTVVVSEHGDYWNLFVGDTCNDDVWLGDFPTKAAAVRSIR